MKRLSLFLILLVPVAAFAQHEHHANDKKEAPTALFTGLSDLHHPVSTKNAEAQKFFDQGLALIYAFNHDEAIRAFQHAVELDPNLAIAHWGIALALGSNYNLPAMEDREKAAYEALQKAVALAPKAAENERAYIAALSKRYSASPNADLEKKAVAYKNAMGDLMRHYPDDLDAATLYAESLMNLRPWKLYTKDGKPEEGTEEIVAVLESVLKRNPNHIGANHYYIHAVEASNHPERGLASAYRLKTLAPAAGHLVHMPAHIYERVGDYENAVAANAQGADADRAYIKATNAQGLYPLMYYNHNLHFLAVASSMVGRYADAKRAADEVVANATRGVKEMPMLDAFMPTSTLMLVRFHKWDEVMKLPEPDKALPVTNAMWHFAQGMALAATGKPDEADKQLQSLSEIRKATPAAATMGLNQVGNVLTVAENLLAGKIALAKKDKKSAIEYFRKGVEAEDALNYDEPAGWYIPVRESLGSALLVNGESAAAEKVFRADLQKNPRNGRSLLGLVESLKAQGKTTDAQFVQKELEAAWKNADTKLRVEEL